MARRPRIHFPEAHYHVILRGNARQDIFLQEEDRCRFYLLLQEGVERFGHSILAFCLMTNHVHLLCQVSDVPLSQIIHNLSFRYTRWFNWRRSRVGHLFQGRYKAILIDADEYLLQLASYIHLNPVRAKVVDDPIAYPWSSHRAYAGKENLPWLRVEPVLGYFTPNLKKARVLYQDFVRAKMESGHVDEFSCGDIFDRRFLGPDDFKEAVSRKVGVDLLHKPDLQVVIRTVEAVYGLEEGGLSGNDGSFRMAEARSMAAWAVREFSSATLTELGGYFGRDVTTMSSAVTRLVDKARKDDEVAKRLDKVKCILLNFATLQA